jgi:hypothetical protein
MEETESSDGILNWLGEQVGGLLAAIPGALGDFFTGVGEGAGVSGTADWIALIVGLALVLSGAKGLKSGKIVGPIIGGAIGVALMGWAIS